MSEFKNDEEELTDLEILQNEKKRIKKEIKLLEGRLSTDQNDELNLKLEIASLKLEINGYKIELENATTEKRKDKIRGNIDTKEKLLHDFNVQLQQLQNVMKPSVQNSPSPMDHQQGSGSHQLRTHTSKSTSNFGINVSEIVPLQAADTLEKFISKLSGQNCSNLDCDAQFFENARVELKKMSNKVLREDDLQLKYFPDLIKKCGDNVLESTKVVNDDFQKINFVSPNEKSKYPDLTLRISTPADDLKGTHNDTSSDLTNWRLSPWAVIAYLDLKKYTVGVSHHIHQALYYAQSTLLCCPTRNYCLSAVYSFKQIIFCGVKRVDNNLQYYVSVVISDEDASAEIAKFLSCPKSLLGYTDFNPFKTYTPIAALGRGSTSLCVSILNPNYNPENDSENPLWALKISPDELALTVEEKILNHLHTENEKLPNFKPLNIPTIIHKEQYLTFMSPVYCRPPSQLSKRQFEKAWEALHEVHKFGICHRDVRIPNFGVCGSRQNQTFHWMDWSSAKPFQDIEALESIQQYPPGSTATASRPVLKRMRANENDYDYFPSDEGISMIYLVYQSLFGGGIAQRADVALRIWEDAMELIPQEVIDIITDLETIGQQYNTDYHDQIDEQVKKAMDALFTTKLTKTQQKNLENMTYDLADLNLDEVEGKLPIM